MRPIRRVMLIYPPVSYSPQSLKQCRLPLGLAYLAAVVRPHAELLVLDAAAEGYEHEEPAGGGLLRYGLAFDEIERRIREFRPDLIGASCIFTSQFRNVAEICRIAKRIDPGILTITGGTHPTFLAEESLKHAPELDLIARGEGEFILLDVIAASRNGADLAGIDGLVWRREGEIVVNPDRAVHENLDEIPFPARDLFPLEKYTEIGTPMGTVFRNRPFMNLITTRGCPFHCTFCSSTLFWGNRYRLRSVENVLAEMEELVHTYGVREFKFFDDNLTIKRERAVKLFQGMVDRGVNVPWNTPNGIHVVTLDEELLRLMKQSGCYELTMAVESGDEDVLRKIIQKPTNLKKVHEVARLTRKVGITTNSFFMIGFPGETMEQIQRTLRFSLDLDFDRIALFIFQLLPGTPLYERSMAMGYLQPDSNAEDLDYFEGRFDTPEWTRQELHRLRNKWFWRYNASLFFRHPIRFLHNYGRLLMRPKQTVEIVKRLARA